MTLTIDGKYAVILQPWKSAIRSTLAKHNKNLQGGVLNNFTHLKIYINSLLSKSQNQS
ncbi:MAG: hypothetical protein QNJ49_00590 [Mastigocoleus sp. MO_167.B18]|uniref:hypothetical protein n=1 Tax=Mastigocoleus sp. MO_188.B34 TaxID=3036635 RepID=UPI00261D0660|nr:hypothetical protein [Mastigocoleus sp. MO_188.B34]MDJ0692769.1 hypothetical protein [Mastigocoleus sp. MO_188.B34]MDJ0771915.1 hypothetical protein [Mastigocoleus sp. MO_167.B18]